MKDHAFPAMFWNPETGEPEVFNSQADVPSGYLDKHPKHFDGEKPPRPARNPEEIAMSREEIVEALNAGEVSFPANAGIKKLYTLLLTSLKAHLDAEGVQFSEDATAPELIALVPNKE